MAEINHYLKLLLVFSTIVIVTRGHDQDFNASMQFWLALLYQEAISKKESDENSK